MRRASASASAATPGGAQRARAAASTPSVTAAACRTLRGEGRFCAARSGDPGPRRWWRSGDPGPPYRTGKGEARQRGTETAESALLADVSEHLTQEDRVGLLRAMLMMRGIEERAMTLYRQGKVPGSFYDGFGQEAVSAGATWAMAADDRLCILHRDLAAHIIRGVEPWRIFAQYMGRADGITRGRDGNVHFGDRTRGCVGMVSMLPDMMLIATGMAMAF